MRVCYTRRARADIEAIHSYLNERSPEAARAVAAALRASVEHLAEFLDKGE
jgi:plasmid stabilization system protein ParE